MLRNYFQRVGRLRTRADSVTYRAASLLSLLILIATGLWIATIFSFRGNEALLALASLAFVFGLRHAMDADHIAAIDSITRRLLYDGSPRISVGLMFSLGHSTVVVGLSLLLIVSVQQVQESLKHLMTFGEIFGGAVSAILLLAVGAANSLALWKSLRNHRENGDSATPATKSLSIGGGFLTALPGRVLCVVNSNWKIYGVGFLFGLGFDTASEIAILVISAGAASRGMPLWHCLLFPLLFTSGMTLIDTLDNILILSACTWALATPRGTRYYNAAMTLTTVFMALGIAVIEGWGLFLPAGSGHAQKDAIITWVILLNTHFAAIGAIFIAVTASIWLTMWLLYRLRSVPQ